MKIVSAPIGGVTYWWDGMYWTPSKWNAKKFTDAEVEVFKTTMEKNFADQNPKIPVWVDDA